MREFSKVYQNVWRSVKFRSLPDDNCRLLYLYILTCQHSNSSGCYDLEPGYAMADLKWKEEAYLKAIDSLSRVGLIEVENDLPTVFVTKWTEFNEPTNAKHALSMLGQLDNATSKRLKHKRGQELTKIIDARKYPNDRLCGERLDRTCIAYRIAYHDKSCRDLDQRPETREGDQTRPETRPDLETRASENSPPLAAAPKGGGQSALGGELGGRGSGEMPDIPPAVDRRTQGPSQELINLMKRRA